MTESLRGRAPLHGDVGPLAWAVCALALSIVLLLPLLVVDVPPILDYPNHLARLSILAAGSGDPVLARMYRPHWQVIPNLAIDIVMPPVLRILPVHVAGRLLLAIVLLLPSIGCVVYSRSTFRERLLWPLASSLVATNLAFLFGFLNFLISVAMAFLVASIWNRDRGDAPVRAAATVSLGAVVVFFCHLFGVVFLAILILSDEAERLLMCRRSGRKLRPALVESVRLGAIVAAPLLVLTSLAPIGHVPASVQRSAIAQKLWGLSDPFVVYAAWPTIVTILGLAALIATCVASGRWRARPRSLISLAMCVALYATAPFAMSGGAFFDMRFIIMAGYLLFAAFSPAALGRRAAALVAVACLALTVWRSGTVAETWSHQVPILAQLRACIAHVPPGARVLAVDMLADVPGNRAVAEPVPALLERHMPALLVTERRAAWPLLFTYPTQQPITPLGRYDFGPPGLGVLPGWRVLLSPTPSGTALADAPYLRDWPRRYDEVLVLHADAFGRIARRVPAGLELVSDDGFAALFRIVPPGNGGDLEVAVGPHAGSSASGVSPTR